ncbi:hypothetical protein BV25DRAFT_1795548 [Artomyces pyxidatus]|uniref:Uncharacterized protein n=1 Tax=Artomyces pyxidatus TaxID=48021 RepID=A0ACB8TG32_9AGAM|nr:hypothetical protein BV25DRAFT_1795548 [Artomyces pyxidatus]
MARLRQSPSSFSPNLPPLQSQRPLRVLASGTLFLTHTLSLPTHPAPSSNLRANSYTRTRNGSAGTVLSVLSQLRIDTCWLVASLGGNDEGKEVIRELERAGINTKYCKIWEGAGVPGAWILHANDTDSQTVINHNPLPDISHEEFISLLGPLLAPENYPPPVVPPLMPPSPPYPGSRPSVSAAPYPTSSAPFDWLHFEGRSVKTTLNNLVGIDGLARERKWRSQCVFSVDVGRRTRQGVEALIPHADVLFLNKHYAQSHSPAYASTPRAFLLSLTHLAPPHALLIAYWGADGAAALSVPTREYFQSSGWVDETPAVAQVPQKPASVRSAGSSVMNGSSGRERGKEEIQSVRSGSDFWAAAGGDSSHGSMSMSAFSAALNNGQANNGSHSQNPGSKRKEEHILDEVGAQDAFVAGMIYALSRRLLPGAPYTPGMANSAVAGGDGGKWRLDECLRFATELAGRKARRRGWKGLGDEMVRSGWFDA